MLVFVQKRFPYMEMKNKNKNICKIGCWRSRCLFSLEAGAGTDAAAMICKAKLSGDGKHYILNGEKCGLLMVHKRK